MSLEFSSVGANIVNYDDARYLFVYYKSTDASQHPVKDEELYSASYRLPFNAGKTDCESSQCQVIEFLSSALAVFLSESHCDHSAQPDCWLRKESVHGQEVLPMRLAH